MNAFLSMIYGTPLYVWGILSYLLFVGIKSIKTRVVYLPKLFIVPLILLAIKYKTFLLQDVGLFCCVMLLSSIVGFFMHTSHDIKIIKNTGFIEVPGSYSTILLLITIFIVKYYFGYLKIAAPDLYFSYSLIENVISGLFSGYFLGRALQYAYKYFKN